MFNIKSDEDDNNNEKIKKEYHWLTVSVEKECMNEKIMKVLFYC